MRVKMPITRKKVTERVENYHISSQELLYEKIIKLDFYSNEKIYILEGYVNKYISFLYL